MSLIRLPAPCLRKRGEGRCGTHLPSATVRIAGSRGLLPFSPVGRRWPEGPDEGACTTADVSATPSSRCRDLLPDGEKGCVTPASCDPHRCIRHTSAASPSSLAGRAAYPFSPRGEGGPKGRMRELARSLPSAPPPHPAAATFSPSGRRDVSPWFPAIRTVAPGTHLSRLLLSTSRGERHTPSPLWGEGGPKGQMRGLARQPKSAPPPHPAAAPFSPTGRRGCCPGFLRSAPPRLAHICRVFFSPPAGESGIPLLPGGKGKEAPALQQSAPSPWQPDERAPHRPETKEAAGAIRRLLVRWGFRPVTAGRRRGPSGRGGRACRGR